MKPTKKGQPCSTANVRTKVKVTVLPTNIALITPPVGQLSPLRDYQPFILEGVDPTRDRSCVEALPEPELSFCSAVPAGLVPRFRDDLAAQGYRVTVDDRRRAEDGPFNEKLFEDSHGELRALLQAAAAERLGVVEVRGWPDLVRKSRYLCAVYPQTRALIAYPHPAIAYELWCELDQRWSTLGLLEGDYYDREARRLVTTHGLLSRLPPMRWEVLVLIANDTKVASRAMYEAVVRLRARRVYTLVPHDLRLGKPTALRLEAMSGRRIHTVDPD